MQTDHSSVVAALLSTATFYSATCNGLGGHKSIERHILTSVWLIAMKLYDVGTSYDVFTRKICPFADFVDMPPTCGQIPYITQRGHGIGIFKA